MAASQKVEKFDLEALEKLKMSLFCAVCKKPPRPGEEIYSCLNLKCEEIRCLIHRNTASQEGWTCAHKTWKIDPRLAKFVESIKFHNCLYFKNGCLEELETKDLKAHEKICLLRDVACPKHDCKEKIAFNRIMDHYQETHLYLEKKNDVLEFKGSLENLKKSHFILECHRRLFYPQFLIREKELKVWVVGHGDQTEINSFEATIKFWINGRTTFAHDFIKPIEFEKKDVWHSSGQDCLVFPIKRIAQYYDFQSNEFKNQEYVEFEMKVTSPKLDEIAKDELIESGVEDSDTEEKYDVKKPKIRKTAGKRKAN